jgi:hypothetical protein
MFFLEDWTLQLGVEVKIKEWEDYLLFCITQYRHYLLFTEWVKASAFG